jgi:hypothetical protein
METKEAKANNDKKPRHRSPNYPAVGLREAVERVKKLYERDGKAGAPSNLAAVHIGFESAHGQAMTYLAALKKFGLVDMSNNRVVPTQRAIEILNLPENDPRRIKALKDAALSPSIYMELIEQHRDTGFPADDVLQSELVTYKSFNPNSVERFVRDFKETLDFAGLSDLSQLKLERENEEASMRAQDREPETVGAVVSKEMERGALMGDALIKAGQRMKGAPLLAQTLVVSIPRAFTVDIGVRGDEIKREDLAKIKSQFNRWIEGLEEAFEE